MFITSPTSRGSPRVRPGAGILFALLLAGCAPAPGKGDAPGVIGGPGREPGRFVTPRGLSWAAGTLWVVDRSGRVQAFDRDGVLLRSVTVTEGARGFPVGVLALEDGGFLLCDTHDHLLRRFDRAGRETARLGGPDRFTYLERAVRGPRGRIYVSEYGTGPANRVHVFDADLRPLFSFGAFGNGPGLFTRAMGLAILGEELFVSDVSDRILVFDLEGRFRRQFGTSGGARSELRYPYGLCALGGLLYVAEYGNHRIQRFTPAGESRGSFGSPGRGPSELDAPWDVAAGPDGRLYVADTGNHRVLVLRPDAVTWQ